MPNAICCWDNVIAIKNSRRSLHRRIIVNARALNTTAIDPTPTTLISRPVATTTNTPIKPSSVAVITTPTPLTAAPVTSTLKPSSLPTIHINPSTLLSSSLATLTEKSPSTLPSSELPTRTPIPSESLKPLPYAPAHPTSPVLIIVAIVLTIILAGSATFLVSFLQRRRSSRYRLHHERSRLSHARKNLDVSPNIGFYSDARNQAHGGIGSTPGILPLSGNARKASYLAIGNDSSKSFSFDCAERDLQEKDVGRKTDWKMDSQEVLFTTVRRSESTLRYYKGWDGSREDGISSINSRPRQRSEPGTRADLIWIDHFCGHESGRRISTDCVQLNRPSLYMNSSMNRSSSSTFKSYHNP